jgi:hypothetical protein
LKLVRPQNVPCPVEMSLNCIRSKEFCFDDAEDVFHSQVLGLVTHIRDAAVHPVEGDVPQMQHEYYWIKEDSTGYALRHCLYQPAHYCSSEGVADDDRTIETIFIKYLLHCSDVLNPLISLR